MNKYKTSIEDTTDVSDTASVSSSVQDNQDIEVHTSPNLPKVHSEPSFDISKLPPGWDNGIFFNGGESGVSSFELVNNQDLPHMIDAYQSTEILGVTTDSSLKDTFRLAVAVAPGFTAAAKALYDDMNEDAESVSDNQYRALVLVSSGEMQLGRKDIQLAPAFTKAVQEALDAPGEDKSKQYDALQHVFRKYGFHYPTRVVFGGKLMFEGDTYSWLSDASKDESAFSDIDINGWISQKEQSRIMQLTEQNLQHIVADGGDESKISCGLKEWISTIAKNPKVVLRGNLRPLYDLLENTTRRKILDIYETLKQNSWIHSLYGVHVDKESAKEPAIKIASGANIRYYPTGNLPITNKRSLGCMPKEKWTAELNFSVQSYFRREVDKELAKTDWADKVLLPGLQGYCFFACKALGKIMTKERWQSKQYISRRHVFLLPGAIKATIEFEKAILDALQQPTDEEKFMELEKVFHMYGYYYPQWVTLGGKLIYQYHFVSEYDPLKYRVESILRKESSWQASGGNTSLLYDDVPDIAGWLETTAHNQALVSVADVWPMYDLFNDEISAQIRQLYTKAYYQYRPRISSSLDNRLEEETALVSLTGKEMKIDCWKGIHFDGSVAPEDAIELKNDIDITKVLVPVNVMGGPEIQYHNRITELSINMSTHAFLPDGFSSRMQLNGFDTAAIEYHIETGKVREQQMLDLDTKYIKATEALKNAVAEALTLETDMKKLHQLKKVFRRFGFYYPTCILLGGRLSMDVTSLNLAPDLSTEDTEKAIDMILASNKRKSQCIGGDSVLGGRQDWIESVQSNQARIQFASMRPLYDILHTEQRVQVQRLFNENVFHYKEIPKIPPGMHFDRIDAEYQATELVKDDISSKMVMLRHFFDQPYVEHTEQYGIDLQEAQSKATVDVDAELEFSKHMYFNLGAQAAWKERKATSSHHRDNTEQAYDVVYVIYKELFLPDYLLQPTSQFKEAISKALEVGNLDQDTYYALQDVFQRFGYYYPTRVQIGGTLILPSPLKEQSEMQTTRSYNIKERFEKFIQMCQTTEINEMSHVERNNHQDIRSTKDESGTVIAQYNQELACHFANGVLSKSIAATETLNAAGKLNAHKNGHLHSLESKVATARKDLRPLYHLLDKWQRRQVRQTYKNIVLADERIRYNCPLLLTAYEQPDSEESESAVADHHAVEKALYLQLLKQRFDDVNEAIEYCRSACKDAGFSISEEYIDDCSHGIRCSQCEQQSLTRGDSDQIVTGWSIELLFDQTWYFYLPYEKNEVRHNHTLKAVNGENWDTTPAIQSSMILEIKHTALVTNEECKTARHVHYGDLIHLRLIYSENSAMMTLLNDELLLKVMKVGDLEKLSGTIKALRDTYLSASGCLKGVADKEDEEITVQDPDSDYLWFDTL
ncbi:hypothetical protein EC973_008803 [Apophysomyces ossiformis]|uniref:MACPF domain-containing protein n=1 Tax=Apophysomyces ossiformis TaxID=679940 RepID=A0A8H7ESN7_9FUNG|nr:hypothetical protein EC973_008803 [Apophysomyces ossiformis]